MGRSWHTLKSRIPSPTRCSTIWRRSSARCSRTTGSGPCQTPLTKGPCPYRIPIRGSTSSNNREKLFSNGRARSAMGVRASRRRRRHPFQVVRYHDILTQCPRPVDQMVPARFAFKPCPERLDRNVKTYAITLSDGPSRSSGRTAGRGHRSAQELRSGPGASHGVRRRRAAVRRLEQARRPGASRASGTRRRTSTTTAPIRSKRSSTTTSSSSSSSRSRRRPRQPRPRPSPRQTASSSIASRRRRNARRCSRISESCRGTGNQAPTAPCDATGDAWGQVEW